MARGTLRALAALCHFMVFAAAVIVTGIASFFLSQWSFRGVRLVYQEVIAVITLALYLLAMMLPLFKSYRGYFLPVSLVFSYLWLTSFIFSAQDWSGRQCARTPLVGTGRCSLKRTLEAFNFIAFFFLLCDVVIEAALLLAWRRRDETNGVAKERPGGNADRNGHGNNPAAAPAAAPPQV